MGRGRSKQTDDRPHALFPRGSAVFKAHTRGGACPRFGDADAPDRRAVFFEYGRGSDNEAHPRRWPGLATKLRCAKFCQIFSQKYWCALLRAVTSPGLPLPELCAPRPGRQFFRENFVVESGCAQQCGKTMTMNFKLQAGPTRNTECGTWNCERMRECSWVGRNCTGVKWRNGAEIVQKWRSFPGPSIGPEPVYISRRKRRERSGQELEFVWLYSPSLPLLHRFRRKQRRGLFCFSAIFLIDTPSTSL